MLLSLQIRDLAIIETVEVHFGPGLNVVTGETGAGKSILIDALALAVGGRAVPEVIRSGATQAEVTALFDPTRLADVSVLRARLDDAGIAWSDELVLRRVVSSDREGGARSRAYVNGRLVSVAQLGQLAAGLVDVTSQHAAHSLTDPSMHLELLDAVSRLGPLRNLVAKAHAAYAEANSTLESQLRQMRQRADREDLLRHQLKEIDSLDLRPGDEALWQAERDRLRHATRLRDGAAEGEDTLYARDGAVIDLLGGVCSAVEELVALDSTLAPVSDLLESARAQIEEASRSLGRYARGTHADPERLTELEEALVQLGRLKRKYGATIEDILAFRAKAAADLTALEQGEQRASDLEKLVEQRRNEAAQHARALSASRHKAAVSLGENISRELISLGMGGARVNVEVTTTSPASGDLSVDGARLSATGIDRVEFLIAPNRGEDPRPLRKIASGGELSRALLAIKRVLTEVGSAALYVFDEVDTGVGGAVSEVIGLKLKAISQRNQALVITHQPQIAVHGDRHFVVGKQVVGDRTISSVRMLAENERTEEVARMLGGIKVTDRTRAAASEMIRAAQSPG